MIFDPFAKKWHICPGQKGHICPEDKNMFLKSALKSKKGFTSANKCPRLAKRRWGGLGPSNQGKCPKGKKNNIPIHTPLPYAEFLKA